MLELELRGSKLERKVYIMFVDRYLLGNEEVKDGKVIDFVATQELVNQVHIFSPIVVKMLK